MASLIDTLIAECSSWDEFVNLANRQKDQKFKGDLFERLTQVFLLTSSTYASKLENVWWFNKGELPEGIRKTLKLPSSDEGIDLICKTVDGEFWSVQSKYKSDNDRALTRRELATFESLSFNTSDRISLGLVVHTSTKPIKKAALMTNVTEIGLDKWRDVTEGDWDRIRTYCRTNKLEPPKKRTPRKHQEAAIRDAGNYFKDKSVSRGKLIMPCGTGKSLTAFWIAQKLKAKTVVVSVPSLALVKQSLADWTAEYWAHGIKPNWIAVCSDETAGNTRDADSTVASVYETGIPTTTNVEKIAQFLSKPSKRPKIIFTTYQSGNRLCEAAKSWDKSFDLLICDEAHKTAGATSKSFSTLLFDENIKAKKRVFMTATERIWRENKSENTAIVSMDDPEIYGEVFHQLSFKEAINQEIICDYKILTMAVSQADALNQIIENPALSVSFGGDSFETNAHNLSVGLALQKAFKQRHLKHAVTFHRSIQRASYFTAQQEVLSANLSIKNHHISSKQSTGERANLLRNFERDERAIISNARCLTEGVDIPSIDCVVFADPKESVVDIVQAAGRAMRQSKKTGKKCGYILLPVIVPEGEDLTDFAETTAFKDVARVITSLSIQDERIAEQLRLSANSKQISASDVVQIDIEGLKLSNINLSEFSQAITTRIWSSVGRANWRPFKEAREWTHSQQFTGQSAWFEFMSSNSRPADIPYSPNNTYRKDWVNWGDWLGTGIVATINRTYRDFQDARAFVHELGLETFNDWRKYTNKEYTSKPDLPDDIPTNPNRTYKEHWQGWGDFLGTGRLATHLRTYRPFNEARAFVHQLGLTSERGSRNPDPEDLNWRNYCNGFLKHTHGLLPNDVPRNPFKVYGEWTNWPDWLGTDGKPKDEEYWSYDQARAFVLSLKLHQRDIVRKDSGRKNAARNKWQDYCLGLYPDLPPKPLNIPASPHHVYIGLGYQGYRHFITPDSE